MKSIIPSLIYRKIKIVTPAFSITKHKLFGITLIKKKTDLFGTRITYFKFLKIKKLNCGNDNIYSTIMKSYDTPFPKEYKPLVSVIVPNYNHAPYLRQRLDCIYNQTYKNIEVILLDDCSTDNSVEILEEYASKYATNTRLFINEKNSGKVFHQWNKGIGLANGEYIWIAESDDYCDINFLEETTIGLRHQSVMLSFAKSTFIQNDKTFLTFEQYTHNLPHSWNKPLLFTPKNFINSFALKCIIPNVSSAVFRNIKAIPSEIANIWGNFSLCGDYLFYLYLTKGACTSFTNKTNNYYRIHPKSTSIKYQNTITYYEESFKVSCFIASHFPVNPLVFDSVREDLLDHYKNHSRNDIQKFDSIYDIASILSHSNKRNPNTAIICSSLQREESLPLIRLTNQLKEQGHAITVIDISHYDHKHYRDLLNLCIPIIRLNNTSKLQSFIDAFCIEKIYTHKTLSDTLLEIIPNFTDYNLTIYD